MVKGLPSPEVGAKTLLEITQVAWIKDTKTSKSPRTSGGDLSDPEPHSSMVQRPDF